MSKRCQMLLFLFLLFQGCNTDQKSASTATVPSGCGSQSVFRINNLSEGQQVPPGQTVEGTIPNANTQVWVIVHPLDPDAIGQFWPQEPARVGSDCKWFANVHFAEPGNRYRGQKFEVRAVADPQPPPQPGAPVPDWPQGTAYSNLVTVVRQ